MIAANVPLCWRIFMGAAEAVWVQRIYGKSLDFPPNYAVEHKIAKSRLLKCFKMKNYYEDDQKSNNCGELQRSVLQWIMPRSGSAESLTMVWLLKG